MNETKKIEFIRDWLGTGAINIFGRPFAGKDFQGKRLVQLLGGTLIGGGDILRNSSMPENVKTYMRTGKLIPTSDYVNIVLPYLNQTHLSDKPLFLSSVGRWHGEEDGVVKALDDSNHPLKAVIYLNISTNESHTRWLAREINNDRLNRHDDTEDILNIRFSEFQEKTLPVLNYYRNLGFLIEIDGNGPRDEITKYIIDALYERASS
jgi:adenylate kinase